MERPCNNDAASRVFEVVVTIKVGLQCKSVARSDSVAAFAQAPSYDFVEYAFIKRPKNRLMELIS